MDCPLSSNMLLVVRSLCLLLAIYRSVYHSDAFRRRWVYRVFPHSKLANSVLAFINRCLAASLRRKLYYRLIENNLGRKEHSCWWTVSYLSSPNCVRIIIELGKTLRVQLIFRAVSRNTKYEMLFNLLCIAILENIFIHFVFRRYGYTSMLMRITVVYICTSVFQVSTAFNSTK